MNPKLQIITSKNTEAKISKARNARDYGIYLADNLPILKQFNDGLASLIYIDPPFNLGKQRTHKKVTAKQSKDGKTIGYGGKHYHLEEISKISYADDFGDYQKYLAPRLQEAYRLLADNGSLFFHIDYREAHYCKILLDRIFGRQNLINEIIWSYDYGARSKSRWSAKHDTIYWYAKDKSNYIFNYDEIDTIPYLAPALVDDEKASRGKVPTDVWWNTIVPTKSKERDAGMGYPTQKPMAILERIVLVHSNPNDIIIDFFAGTGTTGIAAIKHGRKAILIDNNPDAYKVMISRFKQRS